MALAVVAIIRPVAASDWKGNISIETWQFPENGAFPGQENATYSAAGEFEHRADLADDLRLVVHPFARWDEADSRRTHYDLRKLVLLWIGDGFDVRFGVDRVFWGVTESRHLVDIVNQTDFVEDPDEEDKLGQPMVRVTASRDWGTIDAFALPYFRERTFPGRHGRFRFAIPVDTDDARYDSDLAEWHPDLALRYSSHVGELDFGLAWFHGTSREPDLVQQLVHGRPDLLPVYPQIDQGSLDAQFTAGAWLLKLEALVRSGQADTDGKTETYGAAVGGFEYTAFDAFGTGADVGLLSELLYDSRGDKATTIYEGDIFGGVRLALNDTGTSEVLLGAFQDLNADSTQIMLEAHTRIAESWTLALEARAFGSSDERDQLFDFRHDDYARLTASFNF